MTVIAFIVIIMRFWLIQNGLSKSYEFATIKGEIGEQFLINTPKPKIEIV